MNRIFNDKIDAYWITDIANIRYLTGFTGSTAECILTKEDIILITDGRYIVQSKSECFELVKVIIVPNGSTYEKTLYSNLSKYKNIGIEGDKVVVNALERLKEGLPNSEYIYTNDVIENLRISKKEFEIDCIKKAVAITDATFTFLINNIKPGMTEKQVKQMANQKQIELGAQSESFDTIVASGLNTARPHANATDKVIEIDDIITIDFGCFYEGYCSDMTRTFTLGNVTDKLKDIHETVLQAHIMQTEILKPGVMIKDVDKLGRDYIASKGYGEYFTHSTGHGIGLEIHEAPGINSSSEVVLKEGMTITIEPGIYIEGIGGVRIENDILITETGHEILNKSSRMLNVI